MREGERQPKRSCNHECPALQAALRTIGWEGAAVMAISDLPLELHKEQSLLEQLNS